MPRKLSLRAKADGFAKSCDEILAFVDRARTTYGVTDQDLSWIYEYAALRLYRDFEVFMSWVLTGCVNQDSATLSARTGIRFPKHLSVPVCQYLITGGGYFDFRGRDGFIQQLKQYLPTDHAVVTIVKSPKYRGSLAKLCALRNFAAHGSARAKNSAREATRTNMSSAGAWLKRQQRLKDIADDLKALAGEIKTWAKV